MSEQEVWLQCYTTIINKASMMITQDRLDMWARQADAMARIVNSRFPQENRIYEQEKCTEVLIRHADTPSSGAAGKPYSSPDYGSGAD